MNIIETNLSFGSLESRSVTDMVVLHHAAAKTCSAQDIHSWHKANGWSGAGYHFLVRKDGTIYRLRPEWAVGAHAVGANYRSIGICAEGDFNSEQMNGKQVRAIASLVNYICKKYPIYQVLRHKQVSSTDCPGANYPYDLIVNYASEEEEDGMTRSEVENISNEQIKKANPVYKELKDVPEWYKESVGWAIDFGLVEGTGDGINISDEMCRMITVLHRYAKIIGIV